jgi:inner membrane protein
MPVRFWALSVLCAVLPDADVLGLRFGIRYADIFGHRGFMHSLLFGLLLALLVTMLAFPAVQRFSKRWWMLAGYFFLVTASHGMLDAMTNGGYGIAFFSPLDTTRYSFPWQPLQVSPLGARGFLSPRGLTIMLNEVLWVWVPLMLFLFPLMRSRSARPESRNSSVCPEKP